MRNHGILYNALYSVFHSAFQLITFISVISRGALVLWLKLPAWKVRDGGVDGIEFSKKTTVFSALPEVTCSTSASQGSNFEFCVWRAQSSHSSHHPQKVLLAQFSICAQLVYKPIHLSVWPMPSFNGTISRMCCVKFQIAMAQTVSWDTHFIQWHFLFRLASTWRWSNSGLLLDNNPANTGHSTNGGLTLGQRRRRWANMRGCYWLTDWLTDCLVESPVFAGKPAIRHQWISISCLFTSTVSAVWKKQKKCFFPIYVWKSVLRGASVTER